MFLVTCSNITIENGQITPSQSLYIINDVIHFSCDSGYNLTGSNTSTCQSSLQWEPHIPSCFQGNEKIMKYSDLHRVLFPLDTHSNCIKGSYVGD